jgi:DNA-directed RNA polymerase subunit beta'
LADTALKTADAGYLTRRLADVAQDLIVTEDDCMTLKGIEIAEIKEVTAQGVRVLESLDDRILGRVAAEDIYHPDSGDLLVEANTDINPELAKVISESGVKSVRIRSVLTCETKRGVCCKCYGRNLATGRMVNVGEAVGIIAAQSIGEPGTQLTLRTFHIGGTASRKLEGWYQAKENGAVVYEGLKTVLNPQGRHVVLNRHGMVKVVDPKDSSVVLQIIPNVVRGSEIFVADGDKVQKGQRFIEWDPHNVPILTEFGGKVRFIDLKENVTLKRVLDESTMQTQRMITDPREEDTAEKELHPQIEVLDDDGNRKAAYSMPVGATLVREMKNGAVVEAGSLLARLPIESSTTRDITGGLPRVAELFEARKPADCAVIAEINGTVEFGGIAKGMRKIKIISDTGQEHEYLVPLGKHLTVHNGDTVIAGDRLTEGSIDPHDVLRIKGENALQEFLVNEIQEVYRLQGVTINDKHIESIVRQMLRKVSITDPGDTNFLIGEQVDKHVFQEENERVAVAGGKVAKADSKLLGITKASLVTESFISAASFQETTRVLTEAAVQGQIDRLIGLKENVIMGHLIPAGTGMEVHRSLALRKEGQPEVSVPKAEASIEA